MQQTGHAHRARSPQNAQTRGVDFGSCDKDKKAKRENGEKWAGHTKLMTHSELSTRLKFVGRLASRLGCTHRHLRLRRRAALGLATLIGCATRAAQKNGGEQSRMATVEGSIAGDFT